jgi:hypothetical protein
MFWRTWKYTSKNLQGEKRMTIDNKELILCSQINDLKERCKELSHENLLLKSEIADLRITNILLGGA